MTGLPVTARNTPQGRARPARQCRRQQRRVRLVLRVRLRETAPLHLLRGDRQRQP
ncbi:hypothetical protein [Streptomyces sp. NPDC058953]|uniref:hypothetical protein n=1 Tax=Streptomyces sp. NPDC058953 TaxID=3346676 RepID=UPI0036CD6844